MSEDSITPDSNEESNEDSNEDPKNEARSNGLPADADSDIVAPPSAAVGNVVDLEIERELHDSYLTYAMSTIMDRALPDVRDGLKPSQRRIERRVRRSECRGVFAGSAFLVIGGHGTHQTEKCQLTSGTMSCSTQEPTLDYHYKWPELILVEDDFCHKLP